MLKAKLAESDWETAGKISVLCRGCSLIASCSDMSLYFRCPPFLALAELVSAHPELLAEVVEIANPSSVLRNGRKVLK